MEWISVEDRLPNNDNLPEDDKRVLVYIKSKVFGNYISISQCFCKSDGTRDWVDDMGGDKVTYWMPLPKPPNNKKYN